MLEIYNEEVRDLLSSVGTAGGDGGGENGGRLEIRRGQDGSVQVIYLFWFLVEAVANSVSQGVGDEG